MNQAGALHYANERGRFGAGTQRTDAQDADASRETSAPPVTGPIYSRAVMDGETLAILARIVGCLSVADFEKRYQGGCVR